MIKIITILLLFILTACTQNVGGKKIEISEIDKIKERQSIKHKHISAYKVNGVEYIVSPYELPDGSLGYKIIMTKEDESGVYRKIDIIGNMENRFPNWTQIDTKIATPTPETL